MLIVTIIILIISLIIIGILVVPFHMHLKVYNVDFNVKGSFKLTWIKLKLIQREISSKKQVEKKENKKENKLEISSIPKIISLIIESWPHLKRVLYAFLKSTSFQKCSLNLKLGLGDPVDTAMISGYFHSISPLLNIIPEAYITLEPDFINDKIECNLILEIKIRLFWIVVEVIRAFTKKSVRKLFSELRKMR